MLKELACALAELPSWDWSKSEAFMRDLFVSVLVHHLLRQASYIEFYFYISILFDEHKLCNTEPVPKHGIPGNCSNYRPISILPVLSVLAEKLVFKPLYSYFEFRGLLVDSSYETIGYL